MTAELVHFFPLSVYRDTLVLDADDRAALIGRVECMRSAADGARPEAQAWSGDVNGFEQLHRETRFEPFAAALATHVDRYLEMLGVSAPSFRCQIVRSWATAARGGEHIALHRHPHAHIAAVYYLRMGNGAGGLGFAHEAPPNQLAPSLFDDSMLALGHLRERTALNADQAFVQPSEGDIVLFPASTLHFTAPSDPVDTDDVDRITVVCDIVLTLRDSTGSEHLLPDVTSWRAL